MASGGRVPSLARRAAVLPRSPFNIATPGRILREFVGDVPPRRTAIIIFRRPLPKAERRHIFRPSRVGDDQWQKSQS